MAAREQRSRSVFLGVLTVLVVALSWSSTLTRGVNGQLSANFYATTCPNVEAIARQAFINQVNFFNIISLPANILRLAFHDCSVNGCEGSVLLSSTPDGSITDEKLSSNNIGIGNIPVIVYMKQQIDAQCSNKATGAPYVSCADVLALAGREAFNYAKAQGGFGNTVIPVLLGRRDGVTARTSDADQQLLPNTATATDVLNNFGRIGLTTEETVALLGSHTIGVAHCRNIVNRLGYTGPVDPTLAANPLYLQQLRTQCPRTYSDTTVVNLDSTNTFFDNQYFVDETALNRGLMTVDINIKNDARTAQYVRNFALPQNRQYFYDVFARAYQKLTAWRAITGANGQIRKDCTMVNR